MVKNKLNEIFECLMIAAIGEYGFHLSLMSFIIYLECCGLFIWIVMTKFVAVNLIRIYV